MHLLYLELFIYVFCKNMRKNMYAVIIQFNEICASGKVLKRKYIMCRSYNKLFNLLPLTEIIIIVVVGYYYTCLKVIALLLTVATC